MNSLQEGALALAVVGVAGAVLYYESSQKPSSSNDSDNAACSAAEANDSGLDKAVNKLGRWFGALPPCTSTASGGASSSTQKKRMVRVFSGYGSTVKTKCEEDDEGCDEGDRDCDIVYTMNVALTEEDIAQKRAGHLLIESDADIQFLKDRCKQEQAAKRVQIQHSRDEQDRYTSLFTRLSNQFAADTAAGRNPNKIYTPEYLKAQCNAAQLGQAYTSKLLDSFRSDLAVWNKRIISTPVSYGYHRDVPKQKIYDDNLANWKAAIDKAKPDGPWPRLPSYEDLMKDTAGFTPAEAREFVSTLQQYLVAAQLNSTYWRQQKH